MPHRSPSPLAQLAVPLAFAALLLAPAPAPAQGPFTLEQVMSAPFPTALTASPDGSRVAWVFDEQGARNVWAAAAPDFGGLRFTSFEGDDGTTIHSLAFSRDALHIAFIRGDGPNRAGELPNPTSDPAGVEQALWVIEGGGEPPPHHRAGSLTPLHRRRGLDSVPPPGPGLESRARSGRGARTAHPRAGLLREPAPLPGRRPPRLRVLPRGPLLRGGLRLRRKDRPLRRSGGGPRRLASLLGRRQFARVRPPAAGAGALPLHSPARGPVLEHPGGGLRR